MSPDNAGNETSNTLRKVPIVDSSFESSPPVPLEGFVHFFLVFCMFEFGFEINCLRKN